MKKPNLTKTQIFLLGIAYAVFTIYIWGEFINQSSAYFRPLLEPKQRIIVEKELVEVEIEKEPEGEAWIANRLKEAGLNPIEAFVIISKESGYTNNENKFGVNTNGTIDAGTWQINSIHYGKKYKHWQTGEELTLTLACVADKYCSTDWAISKRLNDQNWSAWVGAKKAGIK